MNRRKKRPPNIIYIPFRYFILLFFKLLNKVHEQNMISYLEMLFGECKFTKSIIHMFRISRR